MFFTFIRKAAFEAAFLINVILITPSSLKVKKITFAAN